MLQHFINEIKQYLPSMIFCPNILCICCYAKCRLCSLQLLNALQLFGANLDDYLHLLLPPVVKLFDSPDVPLSVKRSVHK